jgi:hypothetical protein
MGLGGHIAVDVAPSRLELDAELAAHWIVAVEPDDSGRHAPITSEAARSLPNCPPLFEGDISESKIEFA